MRNQYYLSERVSNYLRAKLCERHMSQAQLAELVGVDERTVRRWLRGDIHKLDIIEELAIAFDDDYRNIVCFGDDIPFIYIKKVLDIMGFLLYYTRVSSRSYPLLALRQRPAGLIKQPF